MDIGSADMNVVRRGLALSVEGVGDRVVFADRRATVGDAVRGLGGLPSDALVVHRTGTALDPAAVLGLSDIRAGDTVSVDSQPGSSAPEAVIGRVVASFITGPNQGRMISLPPGESRIGRAADNDIVIIDVGVSRYHATIAIDRTSVRLTDAGSTNGVMVGDEVVDGSKVLTSGDRVLVGRTWFAVNFETVVRTSGTAEPDGMPMGRVLVSPGSNPHRAYPGEQIIFPTPPVRNRGWRRNSSDGFEAAVNLYERSLQATTATLIKELDAEWTARLAEAPSVTELVEAIDDDVQAVWPRGDTDPLIARIGLATLPSRIVCTVSDDGDPELNQRAIDVAARHRLVDGVPVAVEFSSTDSVLVAGHERESRELAYALLAQLVVQHQPNRLRIWSLISPERASQWDWLKWLPHCDGFNADGSFTQLATEPSQYRGVVDRLAASLESGAHRLGGLGPSTFNGPTAAVLLIDGDARVPNEVQAMVESLVTGHHGAGVSALVVGRSDPSHQLELPFGRQGNIVIVDREYASMESVLNRDDVADRPAVLGIDYELITDDDVGRLARGLAGVEPFSLEASAEVRLATPSMFWTEASSAGNELGLDGLFGNAAPASVVEQWEAGRKPGRLVAEIGRNRMGPVMVDIRELGPHALVAGDLEGFLPAWTAALAARYSPSRLNFYLIDSTGGSVFRHCRDLPHTIGSLSDTSTLEIKPALAMLSAELDRREALLSTFDRHSIEDLERHGDSDAFPYLVVCIDRVEELGDRNADAVVTLDPAAELLSLAERGQQLGVHLILGSASAIDERLDARIALRINAARFGPSHLSVGRAPVVSFNARLTARPPEVLVRQFRIDETSELSREQLPVAEEDDLKRLTTLIVDAHQFSGNPLPSGLH